LKCERQHHCLALKALMPESCDGTSQSSQAPSLTALAKNTENTFPPQDMY